MIATVCLVGCVSCGPNEADHADLFEVSDGPMCSRVERDPLHGEKTEPVADIGNGWIAAKRVSFGDVAPFRFTSVDFVECASGGGVRYRSERVHTRLSDSQLVEYRDQEDAISLIFETATQSSTAADEAYLLQLGANAGVQARQSQATSMSPITACGCDLHYPQVDRSWGRQIDNAAGAL